MTERRDRKYVRVYYDLQAEYPDVYRSDAALATWLRLLMVADGMWPAIPDLPRSARTAPLRVLAEAGLIELLPGHRFVIRGHQAERERRSQSASASAQLRWSRPRVEGGRPASRGTRFKVLQRDDFTCRYCGRSAPEVVLDVDHVVPVREGGSNDMANLVAACVDCNTGKSGHPLPDARASGVTHARASDENDSRAMPRRDETSTRRESRVDSSLTSGSARPAAVHPVRDAG